MLGRCQRERPRDNGSHARQQREESNNRQANNRRNERATSARGHGHCGFVRRLGQVAVPYWPAGEERRGRRNHRRLAGQVRHRRHLPATRCSRQQRPSAARDYRDLERSRRKSAGRQGEVNDHDMPKSTLISLTRLNELKKYVMRNDNKILVFVSLMLFACYASVTSVRASEVGELKATVQAMQKSIEQMI